jgi:hypothetical protein
MFAELLGGEVLLSELLSGGSFVRQADVFTSASASSDVSGSAFSNSSIAPTAGSLAQLNGSSLYQSLLSASAGSSPSIAAASTNAGFVESFGSGDIVLAGGSDSNTTLDSLTGAASPMFTELLGGEVLSFELLGGDSPVSVSFVSGAFKHSPFSVSSPSSAEFSAGGYFLSDAAAYAFSYTNFPANEVKPGMLYADAKSGASYSVIGVLQYAPTPDVSRPLEVRYMHRPQEVRAAQAVK